MYKPEDQAFLAETRARFAAGGLSKEEERTLLKRGVAILREGRMSAVQAARKTRAAKGPSARGDALLAELEGL
jgi:hypothetical protein